MRYFMLCVMLVFMVGCSSKSLNDQNKEAFSNIEYSFKVDDFGFVRGDSAIGQNIEHALYIVKGSCDCIARMSRSIALAQYIGNTQGLTESGYELLECARTLKANSLYWSEYIHKSLDLGLSDKRIENFYSIGFKTIPWYQYVKNSDDRLLLGLLDR